MSRWQHVNDSHVEEGTEGVYQESAYSCQHAVNVEAGGWQFFVQRSHAIYEKERRQMIDTLRSSSAGPVS